MPPYIKALTLNVQNLQKSKINIVLNIATYQANAEVAQLIEIDDLLKSFEVRANFGDLSDVNQIEIFHTLEK